MTVCAVLFLGVAKMSAQVYAPPPPPPYGGPPPYGAPPPYGGPPGYYAGPAYVADAPGFYLNLDAGPSFMQDFHSTRFGFPGSFSARPGARFSVEPGYNFIADRQLTLGAEFETGFIYNYLNSVRQTGSPTTRGDYYQTPILANLVLKLNPDGFVVPYIGVGGGGDYSSVRIHTPGFFGFDNWNDEVDPAAQGMIGVRFRLNPMSELGVGYKFLAAFPDHGSYVGTHSVSASFTMRF